MKERNTKLLGGVAWYAATHSKMGVASPFPPPSQHPPKPHSIASSYVSSINPEPKRLCVRVRIVHQRVRAPDCRPPGSPTDRACVDGRVQGLELLYRFRVEDLTRTRRDNSGGCTRRHRCRRRCVCLHIEGGAQTLQVPLHRNGFCKGNVLKENKRGWELSVGAKLLLEASKFSLKYVT